MHERNIMDYFDGLSIPLAATIPHHTGIVINHPQYYSIQFNYRGKFFLQIGDGKIHTASGAYAFLTYPGERFTYGTVDNNSRRHHCYVCTCGPRTARYIESGLFSPEKEDPLVSIIYAGRFLNTIQQIIKATRGTGQSNPRAVLLFEELLLHMYEERQSENRCMSGHSFFLNDLVNKITAAPEKEHDFEYYAELCGVTMIHFRRIFKEHTGFSPHSFLLKIRLRRAADMLINTDLAIKEIASLTGWDDEYYFSRLFKKNYSLSPLQYRKEAAPLPEKSVNRF